MGEGVRRLDVEVEASGFSKKMAKELERYMEEHGVDGDAGPEEGHEDEEEEEGNDEDESSKDINVETLEVKPSIHDPSSEQHQLVDGMTALQFADAAPASSLSKPEFDAVSMAGTTMTASAQKQRLTAAKKAKGWAI